MVAKTPPMGWNSWDCYGAAVTEEIVRKNAEYMAAHLKGFGWEYVVVDIQWSQPTATNHEYVHFTELEMDAYSRLIPAVNRFPSAKDGAGFAPLADYVHGLGLKFGIHIMRGIPRQACHRNTAILGTDKTARAVARHNSICQWNSDMYGLNPDEPAAQLYYDSLFQLYASWGVDYVKVDDIANHYPRDEVEMISKAITSCGREMVLSLSPGPARIEEAEHLKQHANLWRITDDFWDQWTLLYQMFARAEVWSIHAGPRHWPDADMLPVGAILQDYDKSNRTKFTQDEQITMLTLWCIMRSPLMIGGDLVYNDPFTDALLTNADLLEMLSQSRGARQLYRRVVNGLEEIVWLAHRADGGYYLAVFNASDSPAEIAVDLNACEINSPSEIYDLWAHSPLPLSQNLTVTLPAHGAAAFRIL
ncbi:MAG: glycoside hydrolase family 27 protein [Oscillospiraceae bacterium]